MIENFWKYYSSLTTFKILFSRTWVTWHKLSLGKANLSCLFKWRVTPFSQEGWRQKIMKALTKEMCLFRTNGPMSNKLGTKQVKEEWFKFVQIYIGSSLSLLNAEIMNTSEILVVNFDFFFLNKSAGIWNLIYSRFIVVIYWCPAY